MQASKPFDRSVYRGQYGAADVTDTIRDQSVVNVAESAVNDNVESIDDQSTAAVADNQSVVDAAQSVGGDHQDAERRKTFTDIVPLPKNQNF